MDLGEEDNKTRLSIANAILKKQGNFCNEDALNLGVIDLFAPRGIACEATEEVVGIYARFPINYLQKWNSHYIPF